MDSVGPNTRTQPASPPCSFQTSSQALRALEYGGVEQRNGCRKGLGLGEEELPRKSRQIAKTREVHLKGMT